MKQHDSEIFMLLKMQHLSIRHLLPVAVDSSIKLT